MQSPAAKKLLFGSSGLVDFSVRLIIGCYPSLPDGQVTFWDFFLAHNGLNFAQMNTLKIYFHILDPLSQRDW